MSSRCDRLSAEPLRDYVRRLIRQHGYMNTCRLLERVGVSASQAQKFIERLLASRYETVSVWWVDRITIAAGSHPILLYGAEAWEAAETLEETHCRNCGAPLPPSTSAHHRAFCSRRCGYQWHNRHRPRKTNRGRVRCGTPSGYQMHLRRGENPCDDCRQAKATYDQAWRQRRGHVR